MTLRNKYITEKGKTEVLRLAFVGEERGTPFVYLALGVEGSEAVKKNDESYFVELTNYTRSTAELEEPMTNDGSQRIKISFTFDENNLQYIQDAKIVEIGLTNSYKKEANETFFTYCQVPEIPIDNSSSFKHTIILNIK